MKPNFKNRYQFLKELFAREMRKTEIKMNQPVYFGRPILHLTKTLIYELHYDHMQPKYGSKIKLCYVGSFLYQIETRFLQSHCKRGRDNV